jgi:DNA polymerase elongation subunit (family B)
MYVDAFLEREKNQILVVERDKKGSRQYMAFPTKYVVYWPSQRGKMPNIHGQLCDKFQTTKLKEFQKEVGLLPKASLHESDINPIFRCLYDNYKGTPSPNLHVAFFDIEVDFDPKRGFSSPDDAFSPITAISVYLNWLDRNFTMVIKPKGMTSEDAQEVVDRFEDTILCATEKELLEIFLGLIDDADILSGWNSEGFDIPYIHNRIVQVLGKEETRKLCLWGKYPKKREYESYGRETITYDLVGRIHMDYLQLYRKNTYHEMHSYRLDFVGEYEVGEKKIHYEGSLDKLYNEDFYKFIEYNRQDVMLLVKIDRKNKFIELSNNLAHENCVLLGTTMGAVALIDQAIVNEAHDLGMVVPNRKRDEEERETYGTDDDDDDDSVNITGVVGAYVADPKEGMHDWIGGVDINSLYPSAIRALNMSPETVIGHIRSEHTDKLIYKRMKQEKKSFADAWNGMFGTLEYNLVMNQDLTPITVDFEDGSTTTVSAGELYDLVFNSGKKLIISANGTLFTMEKKGIIPGLLARWYAERKQLQAEMKKYAKMADEEADAEKKAEYKKLTDFYDQRQLIKKILLNSLYGAIGNPGSRWYDPRVAQSVTLSGRCIVKHMQSKINEIITGDYNHLGIACIYGDTDSGYFSAYPVMKDQPEFKDFDWSKENVSKLYDNIGDMTNASFPEFMKTAFNCPEDNGAIIRAARELCAYKGLFITKKRYAVLIYDKEGKRKDTNGKPGEIKAMGLDLKRSDTPKIVQDFLSDVLTAVLTGSTEQQIHEKILEFRKEFRSWPGWSKGSPKRANKITYYENIMNNQTKLDWNKTGESKKSMIPGHVLASINWNRLKKIHGDYYSMPIQDGFKVIVCKLRSNPSGLTSVAYPVDELNLPEWFKQLPFDDEAMEAALIDKKVKNLLGVLNWDLDSNKEANSFGNLFSF